jgi:hypothetical protein
MLGLDKQLGDKITAAVRDCTRHVLPPKEAQPLLFSARVGVIQTSSEGDPTLDPTTEYTCTGGVWWNPRRSSVLASETNAHTFQQAGSGAGSVYVQPFIDADLTQSGEPFFNGRQGIVWPYALVALQNENAGVTNLQWSQPNVQGRITWTLNGQPLPGYLRQFTGGNIEGPFLAPIATTYFETQRYSTGPLPLAPVPGINLQSGDQLSWRLDWDLIDATPGAQWQFFVFVRGWMW